VRGFGDYWAVVAASSKVPSSEVLALLELLYLRAFERIRLFFSGCLSFRNFFMFLEVTNVCYYQNELTLSIQEE